MTSAAAFSGLLRAGHRTRKLEWELTSTSMAGP
eukprot:CAMPEP_0171117598 /NCGR_PEP_ID=MMETSP0766_2-20121228/92883_1 /TAXON_ID=439317 /ORGANISM="Gambierdiscus australes, Strain CAWD 149" /LENGTH=32 /DNA_ID= /DNA_START= /DNA_END= /DNA_ORIENTATION=